MSYVRDLSGNTFPLQATITEDSELNSNRSISLSILPTKVNKRFINDISEMWVITDSDEVEHKIIYVKRQGVGNSINVDVKAVPLFFDDFDNQRIYEEYNQHMTAMAAFTLLFADSGYNFMLHDSHDAVSWEGFGAGDTRLETFKRALNRYGAEFEISGNTVHLKRLVGRDTSFMYRHKLNASNIVQEVDASGFWTYAKGYGNYEDGDDGGWENAKLIREYTSPLAQVIGIRHAPPIKDGRVKVASAMDRSLKTHVDESLKVSVSTDIHDLRKQGYALAQPQLGDRVFLIDERIGFDQEVRVVAMSVTKDWRGDVTHFSITIGDEGVTKRHMSNLSTAVNNITNIVNGTQKLPNSVLDNAVLQATNDIKNAQTELAFDNGIWGIDPTDPNLLTGMTSGGFMVSVDGGVTPVAAITAHGVVAETIVGNSIFGVNITSADHKGYFHVNGSDAEFYDTTTNRRVSIGPSGLYGYNAGGDIRFQADSSLVTSAAFGTSNDNTYLVANIETRSVDYSSVPGDGNVDSYTYLPHRSLIYRFPRIPNAYFTILGGGEFRFTGENTTNPVYQQIRVSSVYAVNGVIYGQGANSLSISESFISSRSFYDREYTLAPNFVVTSNGIVGRSTSTRRNKLCEEPIDVDPFAILDLQPKTWFDRRASEDYARELSTGEEEEVQLIKRIPGLIAEDVEDAGLGRYVLYGEDGRVEGVSGNLWNLLIPVVKELNARLEKLEGVS